MMIAMPSKPIMIIKTGSTIPELCAQKGDFEDWIASGLGNNLPIQVIDVKNGATLPDADLFSAVVITGSHHMVTECLPWSEAAAGWLAQAVRQGMFVLGICYGHQLLAHALGGEVDDNPGGSEYGCTMIHLHPAACQDPLFSQMPNEFLAQVCHKQSVLKAPPGAIVLAYSSKDNCQAFVMDNAWGVQFHPEFDAEVMRLYLRQFRQVLIDEGQEPEALLEGVGETPISTSLLGKFAHLV